MPKLQRAARTSSASDTPSVLRGYLLLAGWLALVASPASAGSPTADSPLPSRQSLDEILIEGSASPGDLRARMVQLEDAFYERFNALNSNDQFDIGCAEKARTGTRLRRRYCRAAFEMRAQETEGQEHWGALERTWREPPQPWVPPVPPIVKIESMRKDFRAEMLRVTTENPELLDLLRQRAEIAEAYDRLQRRRSGKSD